MEFLAVVTVLIAMQISGQGAAVQQDGWVERWGHWLQPVADARLRVALFILVPALLVIMADEMLSGVLFGIPLLLFYIVVLLYSLGRGDFSEQMARYLESWQRGDLEAASRQARELAAFDADVAVSNANELHGQVLKTVYYECFERWFVVVFWFVMLGPAAALIFRLGKIFQERSESDSADRALLDQVVFFIEWLPARALALTFAIVGDFERGVQAVGAHAVDATPAGDVLHHAGQSVLGLSASRPEFEGAEFTEHAKDELQCAQKLLHRSVFCWIAFFAILQLI